MKLIPNNNFTVTVFEIAYQALKDPVMRDTLLDKLDISDEDASKVLVKLSAYMDTTKE